MHRLARALQSIARRLGEKTYRDGKRADKAAVNLIAGLRRAYVSGTGRDDRYSQSAVTTEYSGPFIEFVAQVCEITGATITNSFLGDKLKLLLRVEDSKNRA
jgi:hypothetical protein